MSFRPEDVLAALEEARRLIRTMPPAEVPHALRKTRGSSSRRLTPVEARVLYRELDRDEGLRRATLDSWSPPSPDDTDPRTAASVLFLQRSANWEGEARGLMAEVELSEAHDLIEGLRRSESQARAEVETLKSEADRIRRQAKEQVRGRTAATMQDLARARERIGELERRLAEQRREAQHWEGEANAAWDHLDEADRRYQDLRERYRSKTRTSTTRPGTGHPAEVGFSRDPLEGARMLDHMVRFWEVGPDPLPETGAPVRHLALPTGLDPKSSDAMQWVFFEAPRLNLIVDGWNVAHHWHRYRNIPGRPDAQTREFLTNKLKGLARYSVGGHQVLLYLDSSLETGSDRDGASRYRSQRLTVSYPEDADDAIAEEAATRAGEPVVVVTSDNGLAERCRVHGAVRVYSEALAEWMADSTI